MVCLLLISSLAVAQEKNNSVKEKQKMSNEQVKQQVEELVVGIAFVMPNHVKIPVI